MHHHKTRRKPGLPDLVGLALLGLVCIPAILWWRAGIQPDWVRTGGRILECNLVRTHYNAEDSPTKVSVQYEYTTLSGTYAGSWSGFWPNVHSPNQLAYDRVEELQRPGFPLVVLYDPANPSQSRLHNVNDTQGIFYGLIFALVLAGAFFYFVRIYPGWKRA